LVSAARATEPPVAAPGGRRRLALAPFGESLWGFAFISPWVVGFVTLTFGPMVASLVLSFTNYDAIRFTPDSLVGLANYERVAEDPLVWTSLANTLFFSLLYVPGSVVLGLGLALLLDQARAASGFFRTAFYLPNVTPAVAVGALFLLLLNGQSGIVNQALDALGIRGPSWLNDPDWVKPGIVLMMLWSIGGTVVILFAALRTVPREHVEAALIDGAGSFARLRYITIPAISGALFFVLVVNTIAALQLFSEAYTMFYGREASASAAESALFYVIYLFRNAFEFGLMGYAAAMAWLLFAVILVVTLLQLRWSRNWVHYEGGAR
jgi:multiple sugar transport system permease protein